ncbi:hypothetical protein BSPA111_32570 [Buttiauxella sp. A111]|nr:hypothetical protein BSPA111_32570 [Buttiauxella sp. A111]
MIKKVPVNNRGNTYGPRYLKAHKDSVNGVNANPILTSMYDEKFIATEYGLFKKTSRGTK